MPELTGPDELAGPDMVLLLSDPLTFPADALLDVLSRPASRACRWSAGSRAERRQSGTACCSSGEQSVEQGAVGVLLDGVDVLPCVSQGAAPIGPEMVVTAAEGNMILELASKPALEKLNEVIAEVDPRARALAATGLLIGIVIDENRPEYERGDFLIRGLLGADRSSGALAVGDTFGSGRRSAFTCATRGQRTRTFGRRLRFRTRRLPAGDRRRAALHLQRPRQPHVPGRRPRRRRARGVSRCSRPSRVSSAQARSGRSAGATSCTASPRRSPCSRARIRWQ